MKNSLGHDSNGCHALVRPTDSDPPRPAQSHRLGGAVRP